MMMSTGTTGRRESRFGPRGSFTTRSATPGRGKRTSRIGTVPTTSTTTRRPRVEDLEPSVAGGASAFEQSGGLLYVRNFFDDETYGRIVEECAAMREKVTLENRACVRKRLGLMVPEDSFVHEACVADEVVSRLKSLLLGEGASASATQLMPGDVPVEYRVYPVGGSMDWHKDVSLYTLPQYEIVYTVTNTSDSTTEWEDERTGMRYGGWTEPNSALVVQADGAPHRVTGVSNGERSIIKFVLTRTLEKTDDFFDNLLTYTH